MHAKVTPLRCSSGVLTGILACSIALCLNPADTLARDAAGPSPSPPAPKAKRVEKPVWITGDAFPGAPITSRVTSISAEADPQPGARTPMFEIRATFPEDRDSQRPPIRIGISARMTIEFAANPHALLVPIDAIRGEPAAPAVLVRDPRSGSQQERRVVLGATHENGVEVLSGLAVGDIIVLP